MDTAYGVNHPLAQKLWSAKLFHDVIGNSYLSKFVGSSDTSLIQLKNETKKDAGDRIRVGLRTLLTGDGIQGDSTLEGNEEALTTYYDDILINQLRHAVRSDGKMSEQRVPFSVREEIRMGLQDWWTERLEISTANQLVGNTGQSDTKYTGNQATTAPSRFVVGGGHSTEASLSATTTHALKLSDLDRAVALAKEPAVSGQPRVRPINIDGKRYWVVFMHPYAINQLRQDSSTVGSFFDVQKAQLQGGKISDNVLLTGAEFIYNGCIVHEWNYLPTIAGTPNSGTASQFRRGALAGAQALCMAVGQGGSPNKMTWDEETFDYGNKMGVAAGMIMGIKKTVFNSTDFGVITLSGYAPNP